MRDAATARRLSWRQSWRIARRDLHAGFRGLRLLFICLFLGVATLAAIGSLTTSITAELSARGQSILGGDVEVAVSQREATTEEKAELRAYGTLSETIRMRAMAQRVDAVPTGDPATVLTELKGVDALYPLYGTLALRTGSYHPPLQPNQILIGAALADRLNVKTGDQLRYGTTQFTIAGVITDEPDRLGEGFTLGPVAIVSLDGLRSTGLIQPGSLFESKYRLRIPATADAKTVRNTIEDRYTPKGWKFKDREGAAPGADRFLGRMGQFLSLIGLAALVIAGIGVSNGVSSYLTLKRSSIATIKVLGATSRDIARIYMLQIGTVAVLAIAAGLIVGALLPPVIVTLAKDVLPVQPGLRIDPLPLITSAAYGLLIALIFTLPPLARARTQPAAAIFRSMLSDDLSLDRRAILWVGVAVAALIGLALITAREPWFSAAVLGAIAGVLALLLLLGWLISRLARRIPRPRRPLLRLALANLYRPGAQTSALVIALGLALTLFVTLAGIQTSLSSEISRTVPEKAPNLFILDIPSTARAQFERIVHATAPDAKVNIVPVLRGTITAYGGKPVGPPEDRPADAWFLRGERGVTYSATLPEGSDLTAGQWWPANYNGPPLLSLDEEAARILNIGVGDTMTVNVLGREIEGRIASLRKVNWDTMGFNYILVFSPNTLASAPHSLSATLTMAKDRDAPVTRALLDAFPGVSAIAVGDVIREVGTIMDQMTSAILAAASVTIFAGVAVLIGAIAASRQTRSYDSVILKTLGATRMQILGAQAMEYGLLAAILALVALALGGFAAWYVIVEVFSFGWAPNWAIVLGTLAGGALLTLGIGLLGSIPLMSVRPARALRQL